MLSKSEFYRRFTTQIPAPASESDPEDGTRGIYFTPLSMDSVAEMHQYSLDERFYEFFEFPPFKTLSDTEEYLKKLFRRMEGDESSRVTTYWFVRRSGDDRLIGSAGLIDANYDRQSIEWGYGIDPKLWGHGYILQIQECLKQYVFETLEFNRIYGVTMMGNRRTIESILATGMAHEGVAAQHYRKDGTYIDGWRYGMTKTMYVAQQKTASFDLDLVNGLSEVIQLVADVFPDGDINEESSMEDTPGWDSLGHMQLVVKISEQFGIEIPPSQIAEITSVKAIVRLLDKDT